MNQYVINFNTLYDNLYGQSQGIASFTLFADTVVELDGTLNFFIGDNLVGKFPRGSYDNFYKVENFPSTFDDLVFGELVKNWQSLVAQGGSVIDDLIGRFVDGDESTTNDIILTLLLSIGRYTQESKIKNPICPYCFVRFADVKKQNIDFYVCPKCMQSSNKIENIEQIYLTINRNMETHKLVNGSKLYVNWLFYKEPIEFNAIQIGQHEDIDIEKLTIFLTAHNELKITKRIPCYIEGKMSDNSRRILEKYFDVK